MIKMKLFKQSRGYCGPASLKMVLSCYGVDRSEKYLAKLTQATRDKGCQPKDILRAAKILGFKAEYKRNNSIGTLKKLVNSGIPAIVCWFSPEEDGHYSAAIGFENNNIILADPHFGKLRKMKIDKFISRWFDFDYPPSRSNLFLKDMIVIRK